ncbi:hypothetical protein ACB098_03G046000 [Castanea mollissima]
MTDSLLSWVESEWMEGKYEQAYELAKMAKQYDPYFEGVERYYIAMSIIHTGKFKKNKLGYTDLYALLGFPASDNPSITHKITHSFIRQRYCNLAKWVHPNEFSSPMAHEALRLMDKAWAVLGNEQYREDYDVCVGLRQPEPKNIEKPETTSETSIVAAAAATATAKGDDQKAKEVVRVGMKRCAPLTATPDDNMDRMVRHRRV